MDREEAHMLHSLWYISCYKKDHWYLCIVNQSEMFYEQQRKFSLGNALSGGKKVKVSTETKAGLTRYKSCKYCKQTKQKGKNDAAKEITHEQKKKLRKNIAEYNNAVARSRDNVLSKNFHLVQNKNNSSFFKRDNAEYLKSKMRIPDGQKYALICKICTGK